MPSPRRASTPDDLCEQFPRLTEAVCRSSERLSTLVNRISGGPQRRLCGIRIVTRLEWQYGLGHRIDDRQRFTYEALTLIDQRSNFPDIEPCFFGTDRCLIDSGSNVSQAVGDFDAQI